jgi:hypothetical protein
MISTVEVLAHAPICAAMSISQMTIRKHRPPRSRTDHIRRRVLRVLGMLIFFPAIGNGALAT